MKKIILFIGCCLWINMASAQNEKPKYEVATGVDEYYFPYVETAKKIQNTLKEGGSVSAQELERLTELYNKMLWFMHQFSVSFYQVFEGDTLFSYRPSVENMLKAYQSSYKGDPREAIAAGYGDWTAFDLDIPYYIPLYDRQSGKIVSCLILCAGIDGKIDNKIEDGEKLYTDEWRKRIKAYNMIDITFPEKFKNAKPGVITKPTDVLTMPAEKYPNGFPPIFRENFTVEDLLHGGKDIILHVGSNLYTKPDGSTKLRLKE